MSLILTSTKDPDPKFKKMDPGPDTGGQLITDPLDPDPQHTLIESDIF